MSETIVVIGAGVVGLSCALLLAEKGHKVTVIAGHFPSDTPDPLYTSNWAGAHCRPCPIRSESDVLEFKLNRITQKHFKMLAEKEPESSVRFMEAEEYMEDPDILYTSLGRGYSEEMEDFRVLEKSELKANFTFGTKYRSWVLNPPVYLQYLQRKLIFHHGVNFERATVNSLRYVHQIYPQSIIVNASGQGLQYNGGFDPQCFPIRGQTLLIRVPKECPYLNKSSTCQSKDGMWTFVIPRPLNGGVILGGTKQKNDFEIHPREEDTNALISRARTLYPELFINGELDVRQINVGLRPARRGGLKVELEKQLDGNIIHTYGAGGSGFELSYGVATKVCELVTDIGQNSSNLSKL